MLHIGPSEDHEIRIYLLFREKDRRPWLEMPKTDFKLQCREISKESKRHPCEASLATMPHHLHPSIPLDKSEVQTKYTNHFKVNK